MTKPDNTDARGHHSLSWPGFWSCGHIVMALCVCRMGLKQHILRHSLHLCVLKKGLSNGETRREKQTVQYVSLRTTGVFLLLNLAMRDVLFLSSLDVR